MKKVVESPKLWSYFSFRWKYPKISYNFYYNTQIFNLFVFFTTTAGVFFLLGFYRPVFWAVTVGIISTLIFLHAKMSKLAHGISIRREVKNMAREKQELEIIYTLSNSTGFAFPYLDFEEKFDGVMGERFRVKLPQILEANSSVQIRHKVHLNNGMGIKTFEPIELILTDELGIFHFTVNFKNSREVHVYPFVEDIPRLINKVSTDSINFGLYEISKRGDSNLFIGTRHYRSGDPVKIINWKLSLKGNQLVVNEYEKSTNTSLTFLIDLDYENQMGAGQVSTWETAKDLAIGLITKEISRYNSVQVIANNLYIPFGTGKDQLATIEKHFTFHEMTSTQENTHFKHLQNIPREGQIYFLCPMITTKKIEESLEFLKKLRLLNHHITIFIFNPYKEMIRTVRGEMRKGIMELERHAREEFEKHHKNFGNLGVRIIEIEVHRDPKLKDQFFKKATELLEPK